MFYSCEYILNARVNYNMSCRVAGRLFDGENYLILYTPQTLKKKKYVKIYAINFMSYSGVFFFY